MNQTAKTTNNQKVRMAAPIPRSKEQELLHQAYVQTLEQLSQAEAAEKTAREQLLIGDESTRRAWAQASDDLDSAQKQERAAKGKMEGLK